MENKIKILVCLFAIALVPAGLLWAADEGLTVVESTAEKAQPQPQAEPLLAKVETVLDNTYEDPVRYTLGPDDVIEVIVLRHPEFSGTYPINLEGKIQYKFVGDIEITGLTKKQLEQKIKEIISSFVINPEVNVTITEYRSKVIYILGEVGTPGKFYMKSETIPVREAVVNAGLPTLAASMRRCRIITPSKDNNAKIKYVDLYSILYGGNLKNNIDMNPGDVLYVPATVMAKIIRVLNPVTTTIGLSASAPSSVNSGKSAISTLAK